MSINLGIADSSFNETRFNVYLFYPDTQRDIFGIRIRRREITAGYGTSLVRLHLLQPRMHC